MMRVHYNFDWLSYLAKKDIAKFERAQMRLLEQEVDSIAEGQQRAILKAKLWRSHASRRKLTGQARLNHVIEEFWEQVNKFKQTIGGGDV